LVDEARVAFSAEAGYDPFTLGGDLWYAFIEIPRGKKPEAAEARFWDVVRELARGDFGDDELARVKRNVRAEYIYAQDSLYLRAMRLGRLETLGIGAANAERWLELIANVSREDVMRVVKRYLRPERATIGVLQPMEAQR
ncbi:MAG: insulinase family protein, partial [Zetaproteobacteria bacterium]